MDIYVYGDESGTFDAVHNDFFTFGGIVCLGREEKDRFIRRYLSIERAIMPLYPNLPELKASNLKPEHKMSLFRATRGLARFACVIRQNRVDPRIMANKKSRQRFLDFAFKVALKRQLNHLIEIDRLEKGGFRDLVIAFDEHKTATNGRYELGESIAAEFKDGVIAHDGHFIEPAFPEMGEVKTKFVDSRLHALVRASDIVANVVLHKAIEGRIGALPKGDVFVTRLP